MTNADAASQDPDLTRRAHLGIVGIVTVVMAIELVVLALDARWMHVALVVSVLAVILTPVMAPRVMPVPIPSEIQIAAALFLFATLFLGEVRDYYERIWWWDLALHASAGLLLGLFGFLVVYMLNENETVDFRMRPSFVALFALAFSVALGAIWEIFEYGMDELFGLNMQKPRPGDPSGLIDTMRDLIVDTLGAALAAVIGWRYLKRPRKHRLDGWMRRMVRRHPRMFGRR